MHVPGDHRKDADAFGRIGPFQSSFFFSLPV